MGVAVPVYGFRMKRFPVFNAVGKPSPLRGHKGQRDQHVWKPASVHSKNQGS